MNQTESCHAAARSAQRVLRGETVLLRDPAGDISVEIPDAVVSLTSPAVTRGAGPVERSGTLRVAAEHHAAAKSAHTVTVRGELWSVLTVGDLYAGEFTVEFGRGDLAHTNLFDLQDVQAVWGDEL
ncbi:MAG: hypothetical protein KDA96_10170 [Planctomycetaceae bacterium]|nr:hypothetical protein [Planctomycetaceae bacterium]